MQSTDSFDYSTLIQRYEQQLKDKTMLAKEYVILKDLYKKRDNLSEKQVHLFAKLLDKELKPIDKIKIEELKNLAHKMAGKDKKRVDAILEQYKKLGKTQFTKSIDELIEDYKNF